MEQSSAPYSGRSRMSSGTGPSTPRLPVAFIWQFILGPITSVVIIAAGVAAALAGCDTDPYPVDRETSERMASELEGRSFRQFDPSKDGSPRMAVILDFHDGLSIWGQYSRDGHAVNEWEIRAGDYRIEWTGDDSENVLVPLAVTSEQQFPRRCTDCVPTSGVSISVKNVFDGDDIEFRINDPNDVLPLPFPVFKSWTQFNEDEYVE